MFKSTELKEFICVGDIHGCLDSLNKVLDKPLTSNQKYIFVGDYVDRGDCSLEVIQKLNNLVKNNKALCLLGNHDEMFYKIIDDVSKNKKSLFLYYDYIYQYQLNTFKSFLKDTKYYLSHSKLGYYYISEEYDLFGKELYDMCKYIKDNFKEELLFIKNCSLYIETDKYVMSHSGGNKKKLPINVSQEEWLWERDNSQPVNNKLYIYGHTPQKEGILVNKNNICIDTGAIFYRNDIGVYHTLPTEIINIGKSNL